MSLSLPKSTEESKAILYFVGGLLLIIIIVKFWSDIRNAFSNLGEGLGVSDSAEGVANQKFIDAYKNAEIAKGAKSIWHPNYSETLPVTTQVVIDAYIAAGGQQKIWDSATLFYDSVGFIYDTPQKGYTAIKMLSKKWELSLVAKSMATNYSIDLLEWLCAKYDAFGQRQILVDIIKYAKTLK